MKRRTIIGIVVVLTLALCAMAFAAAPVTKYWQDVILKPNQGWNQAYDHPMPEAMAVTEAMTALVDALAKKDSDLAYNVRSLLARQQATMRDVATLTARVAALMAPVDVNEVISVEGERWRIVEKEIDGVVCKFIELVDPNEVDVSFNASELPPRRSQTSYPHGPNGAK